MTLTKGGKQSSEEIAATVVILTFNGEKYIREILVALEGQSFEGTFEVLVIDSGSVDRTISVIEEFPWVRLHRIPNEDFGHGKTRNLAVSLAKGKHTVFLTHDAIPADSRWLSEILAPFDAANDVVAVLGRQIPRQGCVPTLKYEIEIAFAQQGSFRATTLYKLDPTSPQDLYNRDYFTFYSDVNSAVITKFLREVIPYRDVNYAEDQLFGQDLIGAGFVKAYAGKAAVIHSNDLLLKEMFQRTFDEIIGLRKNGVDISSLALFKMVLLILRKSLGDTLRILKDTDLPLHSKCMWLVKNPFFIAKKWQGFRKASFFDLNGGGEERYSLESARKMLSS